MRMECVFMNLKDEIDQNYKITRIKCVVHETLGMKLVNTLNIRGEKYIFVDDIN